LDVPVGGKGTGHTKAVALEKGIEKLLKLVCCGKNANHLQHTGIKQASS
jgi:hypothetical protein